MLCRLSFYVIKLVTEALNLLLFSESTKSIVSPVVQFQNSSYPEGFLSSGSDYYHQSVEENQKTFALLCLKFL